MPISNNVVLAPVLLSDGVLVIGGVTGVRIDGAHSSGIRLEEATLPNRGGVGSLIGGYTPRDLLASLGDPRHHLEIWVTGRHSHPNRSQNIVY